MSETYVLILVTVGILTVLGGGFLALYASVYRKVDQGKALIVNKMKAEPDVTFTGAVVLPVFHRAETMDISVKSIEIHRSGHEGLICQDNIRADIKVSFYVRVNKTTEDVLKVAQSIGCARASDIATLEELFVAKFSEALKTVGKKLDFEQLYTQREDFKDRIIEVIGRDLNGYVLDDAAIDYLEQTPLEKLDRNNILDAQGIRKITEITVQQNLKTNQLTQNYRKEETRQNLEAEEQILELERRRADAEAKQQREIATVKAREDAETLKVQAEERRRAELARIEADEQIEVNLLNKQRQVEVADKDRERVVAIKSEQVERDRQVEEIGREREVERQRIDKEMELEVKRKEIAEVVRTRIVIDKTVAEEEERIKDLRVTAEATRHKDVRVIAAEGEAQESLIKEIKAAEAMEKVAESKGREMLTLANAQLEEAERIAKGKARIAEGVMAEQAAPGLATVRVKEADAVATEKMGLATARVTLEQKQSEAKGDEAKGLAAMVVREREIELEAQLAREKMVAEAQGKEADASATEKMGAAEAAAIRARMVAEAEGLAQKLLAMQKMEGAAKAHEEFRMQLSHDETIRLAALAAQQQIAAEQARVLAEAFGKANIQIMGGDGRFLDQLVQAASLGQAVDGFLKHSPKAAAVVQQVVDRVTGAAEPADD